MEPVLLVPLYKFLQKIIENEIPFLGICLGAQLLAKTAKAKVKLDVCREIGWFKVQLTDAGIKDSLFKDLDKELIVFQWHQDMFEIPKEGILLATSEKCPNQAFKLKKNIYGLQFHIEMTSQMIKEWLEEEVKEGGIEKKEAERILRETNQIISQSFAQTKVILQNFLNLLV